MCVHYFIFIYSYIRTRNIICTKFVIFLYERFSNYDFVCFSSCYTLFFLHRGLVYVISYFFTQRFDIRQQLFLFVLAIVPSTNKFLKFSKLEILLIGLIVIGLTLSFPTVVFVELLVTTIFSDEEVGLKKFIILALRGDGITSGISIIRFTNTISTEEDKLKRKGQRFNTK